MAEMEKEKGWNSCQNTKKGGGGGGGEQGFCNDYVYRISTAEEWAELQTSGSTLGRQIDKSTGCIHLSNLHQVQWVLHNFFLNSKGQDLYLLQIDAKKVKNFHAILTDDAEKQASALFHRSLVMVWFMKPLRTTPPKSSLISTVHLEVLVLFLWMLLLKRRR